MRTIVHGTMLAGAMSLAALSAASAAPLGREALKPQSFIKETQYEGRYCRRLRIACEDKFIRGDEGEGNCRRYRRECGRDR